MSETYLFMDFHEIVMNKFFGNNKPVGHKKPLVQLANKYVGTAVPFTENL